jgi:hypothetical protein
MAENICLMLSETDSTRVLFRVLSLAAAAVDLRKRTVLYVAGQWASLAQPGQLERYDRELQLKGFPTESHLVDLFRHFQNAGGQVWVAAFNAQQMNLNTHPFIAGAYVVDERTLLDFVTQETVVLNF